MKVFTKNASTTADRPQNWNAAGKVGFPVVLALGIGLAGASLWFWQKTARQPAMQTTTIPSPVGGLSHATINILAGLTGPIDLRLYAPADGRGLPSDLAGYMKRVENLLAEYERVAVGKVRLIKRDPQNDAAAKTAAAAAGVVPFAIENGEIIYLGLTVGNGARIESVAPLTPEWEAALEPDVSRAIRRVTTTAAPVRTGGRQPTTPPTTDPTLSEELLKMFPDLSTRSFDDAAQVLRESALEEFKSATLEMQQKIQQAQQKLAESRQSKSEADQDTALGEFQQVQTEQANRLKLITARLQDRIATLHQLKGANPQPVPDK